MEGIYRKGPGLSLVSAAEAQNGSKTTGLIVNASAPRIAHSVHPRGSFSVVQLEVLSQRIQGLQGGELGLPVLIRLEDRKQAATLFR